MNITIIGGAGFIGTNLAIFLSKNTKDTITIIDRKESYFTNLKTQNLPRVNFKVGDFSINTNFDEQVKNQDVVYHLASTVVPGTSNQNIPAELEANIISTTKLLDACVQQNVKKVAFISSGGAVYGRTTTYPIKEDTVTYPISSYGVQKLTIEKLLYLYHYQHGLDYRIIRLANPYGPFQRPNGKLGVITTFVYNALMDGKLEVYGDGSVVRDFIYIKDAVRGIANIVNGKSKHRLFNLGSGKGTSVNEIITAIKNNVQSNLLVEYIAARNTDVPVNYLDMTRYESDYGKLNSISLENGIKETANFLKSSR